MLRSQMPSECQAMPTQKPKLSTAPERFAKTKRPSASSTERTGRFRIQIATEKIHVRQKTRNEYFLEKTFSRYVLENRLMNLKEDYGV